MGRRSQESPLSFGPCRPIISPVRLGIALRFSSLAYLVEAERALFAGEVFSLTVADGVAVGAAGVAVGVSQIRKTTL